MHIFLYVSWLFDSADTSWLVCTSLLVCLKERVVYLSFSKDGVSSHRQSVQVNNELRCLRKPNLTCHTETFSKSINAHHRLIFNQSEQQRESAATSRARW